MAVDKQELGIRMIMYLATQPDYVSLHGILEDRFSGFQNHEETKAALRAICDGLDVKIEESEMALYRLPRTFDGYRDVYSIIKGSEQVYNFLSSAYTQSMVNADFIKEAITRITQTPYFSGLTARYPEQVKPGDALIVMLSQNPGFPALAAMFSVSPAVAGKLLYPESMSKYEMTHPKICLDLTFAADMVRRAPPGTALSVKYEIIAQGMINMQIQGGTGIP